LRLVGILFPHISIPYLQAGWTCWTVFTKTFHLSLSWTKFALSKSSHPLSLRSDFSKDYCEVFTFFMLVKKAFFH